MKNWPKWSTLGIFVLLCFSLMAIALTGCNGSPATVTVTTTATTTTGSIPTTAQTSLTVIKDAQTKTYSLADLKAMTPVSGWAGQISSTGTITGPDQYTGVPLVDLLNAVGGITENNAVRVSAKDGYSMTLSYNQITAGSGFPCIDSTTGKEVAAASPLTIFVAYQVGGQPLDDSVGPMRLGILTSKTQVTDGHWWVKWTQKIEVIPVQAPWSILLEGAMKTTVDKASFESCSAVGCHGRKWTDDQGHVWSGVPLWYLVGKVDDVTNTHMGDAYDSTLADNGYVVHVVAADGYIAKFTSQEIKKNNNYILAFMEDDKPLADKIFPLKLVGSVVDKQHQVGAITKIKIELPGAPTATSTTTASPTATATSIPAGGTVLTVINGSQTKTFTLTELKALTPTSGAGATLNKNNVVSGPNQYKGVSLTNILSTVGGISAGKNVKVTASDGYTKNLTYDQVVNGSVPVTDNTGATVTPVTKPIIILVYEKDGAALDASTGPLEIGVLTAAGQLSAGSSWVKMITKIEVVSAQ